MAIGRGLIRLEDYAFVLDCFRESTNSGRNVLYNKENVYIT